MSDPYLPRLVDPVLDELLAEAPAALLVGPRACGKTTTAQRHADDVIRLDRPQEAVAVRADPDAALARRRGTVLIDEWQEVPEVLAAVKRAVDAGAPAGRFLLTGSVHADTAAALWPGTGRLLRLRMSPLTRSEATGKAPEPSVGFVARLRAEGVAGVREPSRPPDLPGYVGLAVAGGMPAALTMSVDARRRWYASYLDQLATQDARATGERPDPVRLRAYVRALAEHSAALPSAATVFESAGVNAKTAAGYDRLLADLGVIEALPAWTSNRIKRLMLRRKIYLTDTGLIAAALSVDTDDVLRDGDLCGRILDSYVAAQLRPELELTAPGNALFHVRDKDGRHEVDLIIDFGHRGVVGIEVKATAAPKRSDAVHLEWLREHLGKHFLGGLVVHTGSHAFELSERIVAAPIACLWS